MTEDIKISPDKTQVFQKSSEAYGFHRNILNLISCSYSEHMKLYLRERLDNYFGVEPLECHYLNLDIFLNHIILENIFF